MRGVRQRERTVKCKWLHGMANGKVMRHQQAEQRESILLGKPVSEDVSAVIVGNEVTELDLCGTTGLE